MAISSTSDLVIALATGTFEDILGTPETSWLDFKAEPYGIETGRKLSEKGRWELAKDVGGFANHQGGFLLLGVEIERHENSAVETAARICRINKSVVDTTAYHDVIDRWIFPRVRGITISWFPPAIEDDSGLLLIEVPPQDDDDKLFVIRRVFEDDRVHEAGRLAIPMREGDRTEFISPEQVQRYVSEGLHARGQVSPAPKTIPSDVDARLHERVAEIEMRNGWEDAPIYALQAIPPATGPRQIADFYERHGLWRAVNDPESLRESGFNLRHGGGLEPVAGGWYAGRSSHHTLWLDEDGLFTVVGLADGEFLGWALNDRRNPPGSDEKVIVNPLTLIEFTYEFFRFVYNELRPRAGEGWRFRVTCLRFKLGRVALPRGEAHKPFRFRDEASLATADEWRDEFEEAGSPESDAFTALSRVYALFSRGPSDMPYIDGGAVSEAAITGVNRT